MLSEWKAEAARTKAIHIAGEKSDNAATMSINQWAADSYPVVAAHLDAAKVLHSVVKTRMTY